MVARALTPELGRELRASVGKAAKYYTTLGHGSFAPGNAEGGLTTQEEKSMGAYSKSGASKISGLIKPCDVPPRGGLYLLDEPEAPLSPQRQLAFLALLKDMVAQDAQFIIATHSPILMAFPEATILSFDEPPVKPVLYAELEHVRITREFLENPEAYLRRL
jgi:hypothetical protein